MKAVLKASILSILIIAFTPVWSQEVTDMLPGHHQLQTLSGLDFGGSEPTAISEFLAILKTAPIKGNRVINEIKVVNSNNDTSFVYLNFDNGRNVYSEALYAKPYWHNSKDSNYLIYDSQSKIQELFSRVSGNNGPFMDEAGMLYSYNSNGQISQVIERKNAFTDSLADRKKEFFYTANKLDSASINVVNNIPISTMKYYYSGINIDSIVNISAYNLIDRNSSHFKYDVNNQMVYDSTFYAINGFKYGSSSEYFYDSMNRFDSSYTVVLDAGGNSTIAHSALKVHYDSLSNYNSFEIQSVNANAIVGEMNYYFFYETNYFEIEEIQSPILSIYPNPVTSELRINNLNFSQIETIEIINTQGLVMTQWVELNAESESINVYSLPQGIYFLYLTIGNYERVLKFVKL